MDVKILLYDIEVNPNVSYTWDGMYDVSVIAYKKEWELLSIAYRWLNGPPVKCVSLRTKSEEELVKICHGLFDEADFLIAHNGDEFDWKKLNAKFLQFGLKPPSPATKLDTKKMAKKYFKFNSNSLNNLCKSLELGKKFETGGFDLWLKCMAGDIPALKKMETYNIKDVRLLEKLYLKLRPWIYNQPALSIARGKIECQSCGSTKLKKTGYGWRAGKKTIRWQCKDCGRYITLLATIGE